MASVPSAWRVEETLARWNELRQKLLSAHEDERADLGDMLADETMDIRQIMARLLRAAVECRDMAAMAEQRIGDLETRRDRFKVRYDVIRDMTLGLMQTMGETKLEFPDVAASIRAGRAAVIITDLAVVPPDYCRVKTEIVPDKIKIAADLKVGVVIDGAMLSNGGETLTIRTK